MNWGVIGLGHMAKNFANSIKELEKSDLKGVSSRSFIKLIKFGYRFKIKPKFLYKNYEKLLLSNDVDNIYIGTLNHTHYELIQKSIDAGKNILCEKPFTIDLKQALDIQKKLHGTNVFFLEGIAYRSHPQTKDVLRLISDGHIGKVIKIKSTFGFDSGKPKKKSRLYNKEYGGGAILDLGCYPVSISNLIANQNNQEDSAPKIYDVKGKMFETGVDTVAEAKLKYKNNIIAEIKVSIREVLDNTTIIIGTEGEIHILDPWLPKKENIIEIRKKDEIKKIKSSSFLSLFANQINIFEKIVQDRQVENNFHTMRIENSINCMNILMQWKDKILLNEKN